MNRRDKVDHAECLVCHEMIAAYVYGSEWTYCEECELCRSCHDAIAFSVNGDNISTDSCISPNDWPEDITKARQKEVPQ